MFVAKRTTYYRVPFLCVKIAEWQKLSPKPMIEAAETSTAESVTNDYTHTSANRVVHGYVCNDHLNGLGLY